MPRGTTLGQLLTNTRAGANLDPNPALSQNLEPKMRLRLKEEQERLYDEFNWPFLRVRKDLVLAAGQRYYDAPDGLNFDRIEQVDYQWALKWQPLERGIHPSHYNTYNSDLDIRLDPAFRWDIHDTGDGAQIEIWPIPVTNGNIVRFTGIRNLAPLLDDADRADLDDQMLSMFVAAEFIQDATTAGEKRAKAVARYHTLKGNIVANRHNSFNFQSPRQGEDIRRKTPLVAYVRTP